MHMSPVCWLCPDAWLTSPSKNGADINRLGRSHVSVYTGRPQSSTTRALDSLHATNSHTIHLCLVQKHFIYKYTCAIGMQICASMQKCRCKNPNVACTQHFCCLKVFPVISQSFFLLLVIFILAPES